MSKNYNQLSLVQRYQIEALRTAKYSQKAIAEHLKVHPSTICRELQRNKDRRCRGKEVYVAVKAHQRTSDRHRFKYKKVIFDESMKRLIQCQLQERRWSPELISVMARRGNRPMVSHEWIYQWIWQCKHRDLVQEKDFKFLYKFLRQGRYKYKRGSKKKRGRIIEGRVSIEQRDDVVAERRRLGDIEVDLMVGKAHQGAILVMVDRSSLETKLTKLATKDSSVIAQKIIARLKRNKGRVHTLTFDNDQAFRHHLKPAQALNAKTYFTRPYTSQDKGTVENRIGVLRRFLPKQTDLRNVSHQEIKRIECLLNNRPVKKFNYLTPNQVLQQKIALIT